MAERDGPFHHGGERRAADQHQVGEEEEVESERDEEERLREQRQPLADEVQPVGGVESPLEYGQAVVPRY